MEFTYEGLVRYGWGFYNPNHAAALICAIMPLGWAAWMHWKHKGVRIGVSVFSLLLLGALAMTYSRSGVVVLAFEFIIFYILTGSKNWKLALICLSGGLVIFAIGGVLGRFAFDRSVTNRFDIYLAGLRLFAANPWLGVGLGNSGTVATAFILPEGINCRTLVNSHLTLLAEFGVIAGFGWFAAIVYALGNGRKYPAACASLSGLLLASSFASIFDWDVLFDFHEYGSLTPLNFVLSWGMLLLFIGLLVFMCRGKFNHKHFGIAAGVSGVLMIGGLSFAWWPGAEAPGIVRHQGDKFVKIGSGIASIMILYDHNKSLQDIHKIQKRHWPDKLVFIPMNPWQLRDDVPKINTDTVVLAGVCNDFSAKLSDTSLILYSPPFFTELSQNIQKVYLPAFTPDYDDLKANAVAHEIKIVEF